LTSVLSMDVMDISGEHQSELEHDITKTRISKEGRPIEGKKSNSKCLPWKPIGADPGDSELMKELQGDVDRANRNRESGYCGSCYGASPPESG
jgi:hypothetical protein